jgi:hypothetical protein
LSWILRRRLFVEELALKKASLGVILFWLVIPVLRVAMLANRERSFQVAYLRFMLISPLLSFFT